MNLSFTVDFSSNNEYAVNNSTVLSETSEDEKYGKIRRIEANKLFLNQHELELNQTIELQISDHWVRGKIMGSETAYWYFVSENGRKIGALSGRLARLLS